MYQATSQKMTGAMCSVDALSRYLYGCPCTQGPGEPTYLPTYLPLVWTPSLATLPIIWDASSSPFFTCNAYRYNI